MEGVAESGAVVGAEVGFGEGFEEGGLLVFGEDLARVGVDV